MTAKILCTGCQDVYKSEVHKDYIVSPRDEYWAVDMPCEKTEKCLDEEQDILEVNDDGH